MKQEREFTLVSACAWMAIGMLTIWGSDVQQLALVHMDHRRSVIYTYSCINATNSTEKATACPLNEDARCLVVSS